MASFAPYVGSVRITTSVVKEIQMSTDKRHGDVKDPSLALDGIAHIQWAAREMPVLNLIRSRFSRQKPLEGLRVACCLHVTSETANLALVLKAGGAEVSLCASNPLSTQDDVAAALSQELGVPTFAINGEDTDTYYKHMHAVLDQRPHITIDDGADLVSTLHRERRELLPDVIGGTEETTTGVIRLRSMADQGALLYPMVAVNDADTKHMFDNRYGTGQSAVDGITRATNVLWAGKQVVVVGYGWSGRGVASRARGLGSHVIVTEVDPIKALEAVMDGYQVMPMREAVSRADIIVTVTGDIHVVDGHHFDRIKDGALIANAGHFDIEINIPSLTEKARSIRTVRPLVDEYTLEAGRRVYLLAQGRLINLAAAEGHPSSVMDMSFAGQALSAAYIAQSKGQLKPGVHEVPRELVTEIGTLKLEALGITIDALTDEQKSYLSSWEIGT